LLGGGGVSQFFRRPVWQNLLTLNNSFLGNLSSYPLPSFDPRPYLSINRIVPDISMFGSFTFIYLNQVAELVDGTSVSAPLMATFFLLLQNYTTSLGFIPPILYNLFYTNAYNQTGLVDVIIGDNSLIVSNTYYPGYTAVKGYDAASGIGTLIDFNLFVPAYITSQSQTSFPSSASPSSIQPSFFLILLLICLIVQVVG
jgi:subtilase family serine protease